MKIVFSNVNLIDGISEQAIKNSYIVVDGTKIVEVGQGTYLCSDGDYREYDFSGHSLLPGLIDAHVHLTMGAESKNAEELLATATNYVPVAIKATVNMRKSIDNGITTLRDCGDLGNIVMELKKLIEDGFMAGPRIVCSCDPLRVTNGHFVGAEADGPYEITKGARYRFKMGADFLKLMVTGGVAKPGENPNKVEFWPEELAAAMAVAKNEGKRVAAHAHSAKGILDALNAGVDSIEHGTFLDEDLCDLMVEKGAWLVPTFSGYTNMANSPDVPAYKREVCKTLVAAKGERFRRAVSKGVKVALGTDAGCPVTPFGDVATELREMVRYGMTPMNAIISATSSAAELLEMDDKIGSVEAGKYADLVVVKGDPSQDVTCIRDVSLVMVNGEIVVENI